MMIKAREAAKMLGVSVALMSKARGTGMMLGYPAPEFIKTGHYIFYESQTIEAWKKKYLRPVKSTSQYDEIQRKGCIARAEGVRKARERQEAESEQ